MAQSSTENVSNTIRTFFAVSMLIQWSRAQIAHDSRQYYDRSLKWPLFPEKLRWGGGDVGIRYVDVDYGSLWG
jgi:hypothetical protein